jgi:hypothetical protein
MMRPISGDRGFRCSEAIDRSVHPVSIDVWLSRRDTDD